MRYELFIGVRYLRARRSQGFISLLTVISTVGLIIGVMTLDIVLAVFTGFEEDLRDRILSFNPHIIVLSFNGTINDAAGLVRKVDAVPGVVSASPFVYGQAMVAAGPKVTGAVVRGVAVGSAAVADVEHHLKAGTVEAMGRTQRVPADAGSSEMVEAPGLIIGTEVALQLDVQVGAAVNVISPVGTTTALGMVPRVKRFVVVGLFESGMAEYDSSLIYMDLKSAQQFFGLDDTVSGIEVRTSDLFAAAQVGERITDVLGFPYRARDWMAINHNLFAALRLGKTVYFVVLLLIVLVAAFNVVATLIMVVMEKRKDIAILKSMGATRAGVGRIFVFKGMLIGLAGTLLGSLGGYGACLLLQRYQFIKLPKDVYSMDRLAVRIYPEYFLVVGGAALLIALLATLYPARQAARLAPVDVIRYE